LLETLQPETASDFDDSDWGAVRVDEKFDSRLSKNEEEVRFCWYRNETEVPSSFAGMPLSLDFAETVEDTHIYVNGTFLKVERNTGLNLLFSVDVTGQIRIGEKDETTQYRLCVQRSTALGYGGMLRAGVERYAESGSDGGGRRSV
jgi:hypothetical protein